MSTLFLIDGHAQIYRAFHALEGLTAPDGRPTNAVYGFTRMLLKILNDHAPDALVCVFDPPGKTFRHDLYTDYKATRKPTPPELLSQIPMVLDLVRLYDIPVVVQDGFEADDVLGTLAARAEGDGWDVVIVSGDKDCGQLLTEKTRLYDAAKDLFVTCETFIERRHIPPDRLPDLMGLWGDSSDNIPGVPGIGEKIGAELIGRYGSLENLLDHADEVKGKRGEVLRASKAQALLSKKLATIRRDVPVSVDWEGARHRKPDLAALAQRFEELGFKSLLRQLHAEAPAGAVPEETRPAEPVDTSGCDYRVAATPEAFDRFLDECARQTFLSVDTETTGLDPLAASLVGVSVSWKEGTGWYLPFRGPLGTTVLGDAELAHLKPILENPDVKKTGQNLKFDELVLARRGIRLDGIVFDSLLASSIVHGHMAEHNLDALALRHLNVKTIPIVDLIGKGRNQIPIDAVPLDILTRYAAEDADIALRLSRLLKVELERQGAVSLMMDLELPLSRTLARMQRTGVRVDTAILAEQSKRTGERLERLARDIHALAGREFNINSTKQLAEVLFVDMGLPPIRRTETGLSTDEAVLEELANEHGAEIARRLLEYRMLAKLKGTYLDALPELVNPETGRVHTTFSQTVTATGRLSSRDPNLQNIPIRTEEGRAIRAAFVPEDGWTMIAADYSQVELRILAHYSGDAALKDAFRRGEDIHSVVAAEVNGVRLADVTREQRSNAKAVNFGIVYGQTAHGLASATGMGRAAAQRFIDQYFERFPRVREWIDETVKKAREEGEVRTILGRRRILPDIRATNKTRAARAEREAVNTVIQGSAADLVKTAMVRLEGRMETETPRSRMLLQIHDELLFEAPPEEAEALAELAKRTMEGALELDVKVAVDVGTGANWLEAK